MKPQDANKPHLIVTVGIPGAGKSYFAEHFADTFKAPIVSFDKLRKEIFTNPSYSDDEDEVISKVANHMLGEVFKTMRTSIYEGVASTRTDRSALTRLARDAGYDTLFVWVQTEPVEAKRRATKPSLEKGALTSDQFESKLKKFSVPHQSEKAIVISGKHTYASQLKIVLKNLVNTKPKTEKSQTARPPASRGYLIR